MKKGSRSTLSAEPVGYKALAKTIGDHIRSGQLKPGQRLLSLRDIAEKYHVGTAVARKSFEMLEKQGLLVQRHGSGTFVNPTLPRNGLRLVGLLTSRGRNDIEDYYEPLFETATKKGLIPIIGLMTHLNDWRQTVREILSRKPDMLLIDVEGRHFPLHEIRTLIADTPHCICMRWEWRPERPEGRAVLVHYENAYVEAIRILQERGHQRIAVMLHHRNPQPYLSESLDRIEAESGLTFGNELLRLSGEALVEDPAEVDQSIRSFQPTALFAVSDHLVRLAEEQCPAVVGLEKIGFFNQSRKQQSGLPFSSFQIDFAEIWDEAIQKFATPPKVFYHNPVFVPRWESVISDI